MRNPIGLVGFHSFSCINRSKTIPDESRLAGRSQDEYILPIPPASPPLVGEPYPMTFTWSALALSIVISASPGKFDWPGWRGPERDGISKETGLLKSWPAEGPTKLWTATGVGGGYCTPSVAAGKIFGLGYINEEEAIWAVDDKTGKVVWSKVIAAKGKFGHNTGSRSTPSIDGDKLYAVGISGDLVCMNVENGEVIWRKNYDKDFKGKMMSGWGFSESVLIDGDRLICTPGGDMAAIACLDKKDGKVIWTSVVPNGGGAGYASPMIATVGKTKMYLNWLKSGLIAVDAKDGKLLFKYEKTRNGTANIPTVIVKGNHVFCSTGYGDGGSALLELKETESGIAFDEKYYYKSKQLQNHHGGMLLVGDHIYMGHGHNNGFPASVKFLTGDLPWGVETRGAGSGSAAVAYADGMLYFRYQNGVMALIEANPKEYKLVSTFKLPDQSGQPSWPHPVIANGKLYIRDQDKMHCFDLKAK